MYLANYIIFILVRFECEQWSCFSTIRKCSRRNYILNEHRILSKLVLFVENYSQIHLHVTINHKQGNVANHENIRILSPFFTIQFKIILRLFSIKLYHSTEI